jgi:hypothetical protein
MQTMVGLGKMGSFVTAKEDRYRPPACHGEVCPFPKRIDDASQITAGAGVPSEG